MSRERWFGGSGLFLLLVSSACQRQSLPEQIAELEPQFAYYDLFPYDLPPPGPGPHERGAFCDGLEPTHVFPEAYASNADWSLGIGVQWSMDQLCAIAPEPFSWDLNGEEPVTVVAVNFGLEQPYCTSKSQYGMPSGERALYVAVAGVATAWINDDYRLELSLRGVRVQPSSGGDAWAIPDLAWEMPLLAYATCEIPNF